ncbi:MAG: histidine kinase [Bacteroidia bacterium]|nr:histidine kinase [Bacteroidia bacterium]
MIALLCLLLVTTAMISWNFGFATLGYKVMNNGMSPYFIEAIFALGGISIPIGLSLFMGVEGRETNRALSRQLSENEILKNKAIEQEQEKQQILESQKEMLEIQVVERTAQLNQSLENLKATQSQLIQAEKMASLGELTAGIAHEIQNPLNFVNNFSELSMELINDIKTELKNPETDKGYINELFEDLNTNQEKIHHHGKRASNIVKGMLQHSRKGTEQKELTDINALCDEYFRLAYHGLRARDKSFNSDMKTDFDLSVGSLKIHSQDIGRAILNIITNAFHAVMEKKRENLPGYQPIVLVKTKKENNQVLISISDNGFGIPNHIREKIFQPFFTTKPTGEGTGLGLSLAYDIITKGHGGTIEVNSTEGIGTEFIITFPIQSVTLT